MRGRVDAVELADAFLAVNLEEGVVLGVLERVEVVEVEPLEAVLVRQGDGFEQRGFELQGRGGRLLGDDAVFAQDVVPFGVGVGVVDGDLHGLVGDVHGWSSGGLGVFVV